MRGLLTTLGLIGCLTLLAGSAIADPIAPAKSRDRVELKDADIELPYLNADWWKSTHEELAALERFESLDSLNRQQRLSAIPVTAFDQPATLLFGFDKNGLLKSTTILFENPTDAQRKSIYSALEAELGAFARPSANNPRSAKQWFTERSTISVRELISVPGTGLSIQLSYTDRDALKLTPQASRSNNLR